MGRGGELRFAFAFMEMCSCGSQTLPHTSHHIIASHPEEERLSKTLLLPTVPTQPPTGAQIQDLRSCGNEICPAVPNTRHSWSLEEKSVLKCMEPENIWEVLSRQQI